MSTLDQPKSSTTEQQVFEQNTTKLASIETSLNSMRQKISDFESGLRKTLTGLETVILQNPTDANQELKSVHTVIQSVKDSGTLTTSPEQGDFCLNQSILNYLETKQTLDYLAKKDMVDYLEKRDMLKYLEHRDMAQYLQKSAQQQPDADRKWTEIFEKKSQDSHSEKSPVNDLRQDTEYGETVKTTQEIENLVSLRLPVPFKREPLINYPSKLIMPFMHIKIESFETLGELPDQSEWQADLLAFKENLITCAKNGADVELLSFMGNSYSMNFFKEASAYVKNLGKVQKVIINDCFAQRKDDLCESLKFLTSALAGKKTLALDISHNAIGANGCEALRDFFETNKSLEYLWADNIGLSQSAVPIFTSSLISGAPPLKLLSLARNKIETTAPLIASLTASLPFLLDFTIYANSIPSPEMAVLISSLSSCSSTLQRLDIHDNFLDKSGFNSLLEIIKKGQLKGLNISDSNIDESWNPDLIFALKTGNCLWEEFSHNYGEIFDGDLRDSLVYELVKSGNLGYMSLLGMDWEEEEAEKVLDKMRSARGGAEGEVEFVWSEEAEEERAEAGEEADDYKKVLRVFENTHGAGSKVPRLRYGSIVSANSTAEWYEGFVAKKGDVGCVMHPQEGVVEVEQPKQVEMNTFGASFNMPSGKQYPLGIVPCKESTDGAILLPGGGSRPLGQDGWK